MDEAFQMALFPGIHGLIKDNCMSRFNLLFVVLILLTSIAHAQEEDQLNLEPKSSGSRLSLSTVAVSYMSWTEFVELKSGAVKDDTYSNFYGMALSYEKEFYSRRWGSAFEVSALFGQANAGGSQSLITYQTNYRSWLGAEASYRLAYRHTPQVTFSIGPF